MYNPFQVLENTVFYPHRTTTTNISTALSHIKSLITQGELTSNDLKSKTIGQIRLEILVNMKPSQICDILEKLED